ncbi:DUF421 domain-containing protein [Thermosyntropha sp.]|uniref:DUF421 domain-containing protein n=1 Tax=Thermosyntropha sp. TaxID=2740820 RepID=UPI0025CE2D0C|nr:DUF421 domain-containing protein [Thermosyntropha sp.]MBO8159252.1 DUF421 domain-containing protein [Thermosyntropha sp.]
MSETAVVIVRSFIAFFTLLIFTRFLGKQQISQLTFFEYVLGITIGSIAGTLSVDLSSRAWPHWVGLFVWTFTVFVMQKISLKWPKASKYLTGKPAIVIMNGKIMEETMKNMRYTIPDLLEQLREKNIFDLNQVAFAVLENNGQLSVLLKPEYQPVTRGDLHLPPQNETLNTEIIIAGKLIPEKLKKIGKDEKWLLKELNKQGIKKYEEVFLAVYNPVHSTLYIDKYKDKIKKPQENPY